MKAYKESSSGIVPLILHLGTWTHRNGQLHVPPPHNGWAEKPRYQPNRKLDGSQSVRAFWRREEVDVPAEKRTPDRPTRSLATMQNIPAVHK